MGNKKLREKKRQIPKLTHLIQPEYFSAAPLYVRSVFDLI